MSKKRYTKHKNKLSHPTATILEYSFQRVEYHGFGETIATLKSEYLVFTNPPTDKELIDCLSIYPRGDKAFPIEVIVKKLRSGDDVYLSGDFYVNPLYVRLFTARLFNNENT